MSSFSRLFFVSFVFKKSCCDFYLGEKHVADRKDRLDAAKELLLFFVANGAEFPQRSGVYVVNGPQTNEEFALRVDQILRQSKPRIRFCNENE